MNVKVLIVYCTLRVLFVCLSCMYVCMYVRPVVETLAEAQTKASHEQEKEKENERVCALGRRAVKHGPLGKVEKLHVY